MRFVPIKSAEKQASSMTFKVRDLLVRQRTQTINSLRGHLMEFGLGAAQRMQNVPRLRQLIETHPDMPEIDRSLSFGLLQHIESVTDKINVVEQDLRTRARQDEVASRLTTIPGIGAICATGMEALAPSAAAFSKGRDFAAWIGLTPKQNSSGGKERLGKTSKMGQRDLRRLLIIGATTVVRWARRRGAPAGPGRPSLQNRAGSVPIPEVNFDRIDEVSIYEGLEQESRAFLVDFDPLRNVLYVNWRCSPSKAEARR